MGPLVKCIWTHALIMIDVCTEKWGGHYALFVATLHSSHRATNKKSKKSLCNEFRQTLHQN